jgi:hypothetical protein
VHAARPPCGDSPLGVGLHVPSAPSTSQASHWPWQRVSQHTPSTQNPLAQAASLAHEPPGPTLGVQAPPAQ